MTARAAPHGAKPEAAPGGRRRWLFIAPAAVFGLLAVVFAVGLTLDPSKLPSALIGDAVPSFDLPAIPGRPPGLSSDDLTGEVSIVNVFASWCTACKQEHPYWMQLKASGIVPLHGLNYKDESQDALDWLNSLGDPYDRVGADRDGRVAIDFGVYGVPETFIIGADGRVAYKHVGPIDPRALDEVILPLVRKLQQEAAVAAR
ncbi:DsbE family thiol:disulfide interchange protein [Caenispirillum salinarum]|uniref:DsbE family thiol:disulfide interchange protein n=1 Tax=Caenispirillum salinarum TaxID=859058 RepID=UPI00384A7CB8